MPYGAAASIVVLALVVVGAVAIGHSGGESKKSASPAATSAAASASSATIASGTNYTAADLRSQVASVVASTDPDAASNFPGLAFGLARELPARRPLLRAAAASSAPLPQRLLPRPLPPPRPPPPRRNRSVHRCSRTGVRKCSSGRADRAGLAPAAPVTAPAGPLADPAALARCIQILAGKAEQPLLVDYATFNGAPSTIIVLPGPRRRAQTGRLCRGRHGQLREQ